jgi:hypothetical protein
MPARQVRPPTAVLVACAVAFGALACSEQLQGNGGIVCTDPSTGQCGACLGAVVCVDPISCKVIACAPTDVHFGFDTDAVDSAETPDAAATDDVPTPADIPDVEDAFTPADTPDVDANAQDVAEVVDTDTAAPTGTLTCAQITGCIGQCPVGATACKDLCLSQGTATAQLQLSTLTTCITATCKAIYDSGQYSETMFCLYTYCGAEQAACMGSGSGTCSQLNSCLGGCGTSAVCNTNCHAQASVAAATDYYGLMACVALKCGAQTGSAQNTCAQTYCNPSWQKCFGGTSTGLSCQGILTCAAKCTTTECAQACKAKGTTQAQQAIDTLVQCQSQKCGSYCQYDTPQCTSCMNTYCAAAQNACS